MPFTCPRCKRTSYNASDIKHRYCGYCHQYHTAAGSPVIVDEDFEEAPEHPSEDDGAGDGSAEAPE